MRRFFSLFFTLMFVAMQASPIGITYANLTGKQLCAQACAGEITKNPNDGGSFGNVDSTTDNNDNFSGIQLNLKKRVNSKNKINLSKRINFNKMVSLEKTPIDVVYCYADLWDPSLHRGELDKSIKKDYDNQELKYSLRSVLKNIPWVRKIFIIMPNDKVRFLKAPEEISDRIVYVKNEDVCGFDTNSPHVKRFNMWKLKKFGCSNHIIFMDDDYFMGKSLKKSDFFYVENNKVVPYVFSRRNIRARKLKEVETSLNNIKDKNKGTHPEANGGWHYQALSSYIFLMKNALKKDIINVGEDLFHMAFGLNLDDLKEIYDFIKNSKYAKDSLYAKCRSNDSLLPQPTYLYYVLNKYARKVRYPSTRYVDLANCPNANFNADLFVINESAQRFNYYKKYDHINARLTMKRLFPDPTPYEIPNIKLDEFDSDKWQSIIRSIPRRSLTLKKHCAAN